MPRDKQATDKAVKVVDPAKAAEKQASREAAAALALETNPLAGLTSDDFTKHAPQIIMTLKWEGSKKVKFTMVPKKLASGTLAWAATAPAEGPSITVGDQTFEKPGVFLTANLSVNRSKELTVGDQKEERPAKRRRKNKDDGEKEKGDGAAEGAGDAEEA